MGIMVGVPSGKGEAVLEQQFGDSFPRGRVIYEKVEMPVEPKMLPAPTEDNDTTK